MFKTYQEGVQFLRIEFFYSVPNASIMSDNVDELIRYFFCSSIYVTYHMLTFFFLLFFVLAWSTGPRE
jgi:hypothetical protein